MQIGGGDINSWLLEARTANTSRSDEGHIYPIILQGFIFWVPL